MATNKILNDITSIPYLEEPHHLLYAFMAISVLFIVEFYIEYKKVNLNNNYIRVCGLCAIGLVSLILSFGVFDGGQFIYFQF